MSRFVAPMHCNELRCLMKTCSLATLIDCQTVYLRDTLQEIGRRRLDIFATTRK